MEILELLERIDGWNLLDTKIAEYEMVSGIDVSDYYCIGGECNQRGNKLIRGLIIDSRTMDYYRFAFNSNWCPDDQKEWLYGVMVRQCVHMIQTSKRNQQIRTKTAFENFKSSFAF